MKMHCMLQYLEMMSSMQSVLKVINWGKLDRCSLCSNVWFNDANGNLVSLMQYSVQMEIQFVIYGFDWVVEFK